MVVVINKNKTAKEIKVILESKISKSNKEGNLAKHFGELKRNLDGLNYQIEIRKNEN